MNYQISEQDVGSGFNADSPFIAGFLDLPSVIYAEANRWGVVFASCSRSLKSQAAIRQQIGRFAPNSARAFLVTGDGAPLARAIAYVDPALVSDESIGQIGYFESLDDQGASALLFEAAANWLRGRGAQRIIGPMDGDTWHRYRLNVGPFEQPFFFLEPVNPPYYQRLWESYGFSALEEYYSMRVDLHEVATAYHPAAQQMRELGYFTRAIDLSRFEDELTLLYALTTEIFSGNFLYTPISREEYLKMYLELRPMLRSENITFIHAPSGDAVGFLFGIPDFLEGTSPHTFNLKTLGVRAEHRRAGLAKGLFSDAYDMALAQGFAAANLCLIRQGNPSGYLDAGKGQQIRTYLLYELR